MEKPEKQKTATPWEFYAKKAGWLSPYEHAVLVTNASCDADGDTWHERFQQSQRELEAERSLADKLHESLMYGSSYPSPDVLERLANAADILLHEKDYDGHGWELMQTAMEQARQLAINQREAAAAYRRVFNGRVP